MDIKCALISVSWLLYVHWFLCHGYQMCTDFSVMDIKCAQISVSWLLYVHWFLCYSHQMCTDFCVIAKCALIFVLQPSNVHWFLNEMVARDPWVAAYIRVVLKQGSKTSFSLSVMCNTHHRLDQCIGNVWDGQKVSHVKDRYFRLTGQTMNEWPTSKSKELGMQDQSDILSFISQHSLCHKTWSQYIRYMTGMKKMIKHAHKTSYEDIQVYKESRNMLCQYFHILTHSLQSNRYIT